MVARLALALVVTGACGRIGFDNRGSAGPSAIDAGGDAGADSGASDGPGDAAPQPPTLVQGSTVTSVVGNVVLSLPAASTAGTLLVATIATNDTAGVSLPAGWLLATQSATNGVCAAVIAYYPANPGGVTGATFMQLAGDPAEGVISEWSGAAAQALDATGTGSSGNPVGSQPVQTSGAAGAGEFAITAYCEDVNSPTYTPGTGWTRLGTFSTSSANPSFETDYQLGLPAASAAETTTSSVQGKYNAAIASFRPQ